MRFIAVIITALLLLLIFTSYDTARLAAALSGMEIRYLGLLALLLLSNLALVSLRFHIILRRFNLDVPFWPSWRANVLSQIGGLLLFQVVGQFLGRVAFLRRHGVPAATVASITLYEKVTSLVAGLILMIGGLVLLLGQAAGKAVTDTIGSVPLPQLGVILLLAIGLSLRSGALRFERRLWRQLMSWRILGRVLEVGALTLASQGCMVAAYVVVAGQISSLSLSLIDLAAAGSVVMFAASLPISVSGWGVREMSSVYALGLLGVAAEDAVAVSLLVGFTALVCLLAVAGILAVLREAKPDAVKVCPSSTQETLAQDKAALVLLTVLTGAAVFFQLHIPVQGMDVNVNLADPLALTGGAYFAFRWAIWRHWPLWRLSWINGALLAMTASLLLAFAVGWMHFGATPWAVHNRLLGWMVILSYFFTGGVIATQWGANGTRRLLDTVAAAGVVIAYYIVLTDWTHAFGLSDLAATFFPSFELLSPNRNSETFELLLALIATMTLSRGGHWARIGGIGAAVFLLGSRAGWGTGVAVLLLGGSLGQIPIRRLLSSLLLGVVLVVPIFVLGSQDQVQSILHESSDNERWKTFVGAYHIWLAHPLLGGGLGAFMAEQMATTGRPLVIHNTFLWLLAEFGPLGSLVFGGSYLGLIHWCCQVRLHKPHGRLATGVLLMLVTIGLFSMAHEVLYQRIFWLLLGGMIGIRYFGPPQQLRR